MKAASKAGTRDLLVAAFVAAVFPAALAQAGAYTPSCAWEYIQNRPAGAETAAGAPGNTAVVTVVENGADFDIRYSLSGGTSVGSPATSPGALDLVFKSIWGLDGAIVDSLAASAPIGTVREMATPSNTAPAGFNPTTGIRNIAYDTNTDSYNVVFLQPAAYDDPDNPQGRTDLQDAAVLNGVGAGGSDAYPLPYNGIEWLGAAQLYDSDTKVLEGTLDLTAATGTWNVGVTTYGTLSFSVLPSSGDHVDANGRYYGVLYDDLYTECPPVEAVVIVHTRDANGVKGCSEAPEAATRMTVECGDVTLGSDFASNTYMTIELSEPGTSVTITADQDLGGIDLQPGTCLQLGTGQSGQNGSVGSAGMDNAGSLAIHNFEDQAHAGAISGAGDVSKAGPGTLTLAGDSDYTGPTVVSEGKLLVNGSLGNTAVTVESGGALGGTGDIGGAVVVRGVLSPGASVESLSCQSLTFQDGSAFECELDSGAAPGAACDLQKVTGDLDLVGTVSLDLSDIADSPELLAMGTTFTLINYGGTWNGGVFTFSGAALADESEFVAGLNQWRIDYDAAAGGVNFSGEYAGGGYVNVTVVPEPGSAMLLLVGAGWLWRRRAGCGKAGR